MADKPAPTLPTAEQLARYAQEFNKSKTLAHFGVQVSFPEGKRVEVTMPQILPEHRGGLGTDAVNGGVLAAIFDLAIGCTPALLDPTRRTATMQLSMSFERPVRGETFKAIGEIDSAGDAVLFASARIIDGHGKECARCQGVVRRSSQAWRSGDSPAIN